MPTDDASMDAWCAAFDEVERDVFTLLSTRWMWRALTGLMKNGVPERQYVVVQNYLIRTYYATMCTGIRREIDNDRRTTSLARCLRTLVSVRRSRRALAIWLRRRTTSVGGPAALKTTKLSGVSTTSLGIER